MFKFCSLCRSWQGQWRWQGYHVQAYIQSPIIKNQNYKNEGHSENMGFDGKTIWRFQTKNRTKTLFPNFQKTPVGHQDPKAINWISPLYTVRITQRKTWKKAFIWKLLELCKTRTKKSSPDMFNFYVVLAGRDTAGIPHKGKNSKPHHYKKRYKNRRTFRKHGF